jgi:predicted outer membrane protein
MPLRFVALLAAATALVLGCAVPASAGELQQADRTLLTRLKQHTLWAVPSSRLAADRATNRRVRAVAVRIADDQARLDVALRAVADRLAITLPGEPTATERTWADEIAGDSGDQFDHAYVNRLRAEYGTLFALASDVRAGTRDDDVRAFAQTAVDTALGHLTLLESTGLAETTSLLVSATETDTLDGGAVALGAAAVAVAALVTFGLLRLLGTPGRTPPRTRR